MIKIQTPSSRSLRDALVTATKCISSKNSIAILDCILLSQKDGKFYFTTSSQDAQLTIPAPLEIVGGKYESPIALIASGLIAYLQSLPECVVTLTIDGALMHLEYCTGKDSVRSGKASLTVQSGEEFPFMQGIDTDAPLHLQFATDRLLPTIGLAQRFSADDELRLVMNTLAIDVAQDASECYFVATNGHKLIKITHTQDEQTGGCPFYKGGTPQTILIHKKYFKALSAFDKAENIDVEYDGATVRFTSDDIELIVKAVEGRYPNYNSVIPRNDKYICFDKKEMLSVLSRVAVFGNESTPLVRFTKEGMFVNIKAENIDFNTCAEDQVLITDSECVDGFAIGFHSRNFADVINAIPSDEVRISLGDPSRAAVVTANTANPTTLTLAMPMILN